MMQFGSHFRLNVQGLGGHPQTTRQAMGHVLRALENNFPHGGARRANGKEVYIPGHLFARIDKKGDAIEIACQDKYDGWVMDATGNLMATLVFTTGIPAMGDIGPASGRRFADGSALDAFAKKLRPLAAQPSEQPAGRLERLKNWFRKRS